MRLIFNVIFSIDNLFKMKKIAYLFVMIAGMTLASVSVNAQDTKSAKTPVAKEVKAACCKNGGKASGGSCCMKQAASAGANTNATMTDQKGNGKTGTCCATKTEASVAKTKVSKTVN